MSPAPAPPRPTQAPHGDEPGRLLLSLYDAAVDAARPASSVGRAVRRLALPAPGAVHVLALGKAAHAMTAAAAAALARRGVAPAGGVVVAHHDAPAPHPALAVTVGDHPWPGTRSRSAADAIGRAAAAVGPEDLALVLLSGGASALAGDVTQAARDRLGADALATLTRRLTAEGAPIDVLNRERRRIARWGAGRLALALLPARVVCLAISDVPADDAALIGSGPCVPEPGSREAAALAGAMAIGRVRTEIVRSNRDAREGAAAAARARGLGVVLHDALLAGEARDLGAVLVATLRSGAPGLVHVWGGEPTVTLDGASGRAPDDALGGRMQELALAAAGALHEAGAWAEEVALLAAGTDGRDGPTDAAGALVDGRTWGAIRGAGRDPAADLAAHRSHRALGAAGALLPAAPTGTNVADVVIALSPGRTPPSAARVPRA